MDVQKRSTADKISFIHLFPPILNIKNLQHIHLIKSFCKRIKSESTLY